MYFTRSDGKKVKDLKIIEKATPYFMPERVDSMNMFTQPVACDPLDKFIAEQKKKGIVYSYTEILIAAFVRLLHERPKCNRFVNNCIIYQRKKIYVSLVIKKVLHDEGEQATLKFEFCGKESLAEIKQIVNDEIAKNTPVDAEAHKATKTAGALTKLPNWLFRWAMRLLRFLDKINCLPKAFISASPFHTSVFITDLRSIKMDKIYHHLYNFGNTGIFGALGKVKHVPVSDRLGNISVQKQMDLGLVLDERIADGLYFGNSSRLLEKYLQNPELLIEGLPKTLQDYSKKEQKQMKKQAKIDKKQAKSK